MSETFTYPSDAVWQVTFGEETFTGPSAYDVLSSIGERSYAPLDNKLPKRGLAYRAFVQFRILIDDRLPDAEFLTKLAEFGVITLNVRGTRPNDVLAEAVDFAESWYGPGDKRPDIVNSSQSEK